MVIQKYQFGKIVVDSVCYQSDLIIFPDHIQDHWWRKEGHYLSIEDLSTVIEYQPDILVIGTGMYGLMKVDDLLIDDLRQKGIKDILVFKSRMACNEYNRLRELKKVIALHLTC